MSFLSILESEFCYVESQIESEKMLRETQFVKQIAFIGSLLSGAIQRRHVGCSSINNISRQLCRVKEQSIE
jgi:hypothetical protein